MNQYQAQGGGMAEEITHAVAPIATIPPQSLLAGELHQLRQKRKRISVTEVVKANEAAQKVIIAKLVAMGREDLTR